jgi:thiol-disulfide isomerase/thioredoxin
MRKQVTLLFYTLLQILISAQTIKVQINNLAETKATLFSISGEKTSIVDSLYNIGEEYFVHKPLKTINKGQYRIILTDNWFDIIYEGKDVELKTDAYNLLDSMKVLSSESNKLFYLFIKLNKQYKIKTELLQLILARFPKDDPYYSQTKKRLQEIQNEYIEFVNITAQKEPVSFIARYIRSAQLPILDEKVPLERQLDYLKSHALDIINFNDASLTNSDVFTNKTIEYLTYYRNPQLPKELLEKEFIKAVDTLLNKAKVNQLVYQHITEYLIEGFKKHGFDQVLDYIVENYVIKDDLCLDVKTEGMIKRRIEQAKYFKIGVTVPEIVLPDSKGNEIKLSKLKGGKSLIVFYASWCPHCKELLPKLNDFIKQQKEKMFDVFAISLDNKKEDWINFVKDNCSSFINVSDLKGWDGKASDDYFIYATPTLFLVDNGLKLIAKPMTLDEVELVIK